MCSQGQFGRASKVLPSEDLAPNKKATLKALESYNRKKSYPVSVYLTTLHPMSSNSVKMLFMKTFSRHTAALPSKMFPEHLRHAVDCTATDRSEFALKMITKFLNFGSRGLFPDYFFQSTLLRFTHGFIQKEMWGASDSSWQSVATPHSKMFVK